MFPITVQPQYDAWSLILGLLTILGILSGALAFAIYITSKKDKFELILAKLLFYFFSFVVINDLIFIFVNSLK